MFLSNKHGSKAGQRDYCRDNSRERFSFQDTKENKSQRGKSDYKSENNSKLADFDGMLNYFIFIFMAFFKSRPVTIQSLWSASASRWKPILRSGILRKLCPVISKADAKPFKKVGSFKFKILLNLSTLSIITKFQVLFNSYLSAFFFALLLLGFSRAVSGYRCSCRNFLFNA